MLLSDEKVKLFLSSEVVPAWQSIRPVPKVKIDFGNGKVMERTLKGNTVLYLCNPDGQVIDAFPGVYTPSDFLAEVGPAMRQWKEEGLVAWHQNSVNEKVSQEQMRITMSKARVESPLLEALGLFRRSPAVGSSTPADSYERLTRKLEDLSDKPLRPDAVARQAAPGDHGSPEELGKAAVQVDSRQNVRIVRPAIHMLLAKFSSAPKISQIDKRIFKEILKLDIDDPYLGLGELVLPGTPPPGK